MIREVPARTVLEEEVDVVLGLGKIDELNYVLVVDGFPGFYFVFERVDEVLLG